MGGKPGERAADADLRSMCERSEMPSSKGALTAIAIAASSDSGSKLTAARPPLSATLAEVDVGGLRAKTERRQLENRKASVS